MFGVCFGSFLGVVIYRTLNGMSPYSGRSICDHCKRQLAWYENIPLLSFLALRGKCRTCHKKIDWTYPAIEFITGMLFVWWATLGFAFFHLNELPYLLIQPAFWLFVGIILIIIFVIDYLYGIIPDYSIVLLGGASLVYRLSLVISDQMKWVDFSNSLIAGLIAFLFFMGLFLVTKGKGIGFGDVKLAPVMGFLLGFPKAIVGFYLSFVLGGLVGILLLLWGKKKFGQTIPFGPFMVVGLVLGLMYGETIWLTYLKLISP